MAQTNFKVFNEEMNSDRTFSDSEYEVATQRQGGVIPGMALSRLHNKLYRQSTAMAKAIADFLVAQGLDCMDNDVPAIAANLQAAVLNIGDEQVEGHNTDPTAHGNRYLEKIGDSMNGPLVLAADPVEPMEAVPKQYVDASGGLNNWRSSKTVSVGDICYSKNAPSYVRLECVTAGVTGSTEPAWPAVGQYVIDGTVKWRVRDIKSGGVSIGTVMPFLATKAQPGWLALDAGAMVSRSTYPDLWAWVQENAPLITEAEWQAQAAVQTSVAAYSAGDGVTTFRLPRILDYVRGGLTSEVGTYLPDQNKNHNHSVYMSNDDGYPSGAGAGFGLATNFNSPTIPGGVAILNQTAIGDSGGDENRPKSVKFLYCVKAFDDATNQGLIDITALANEMAAKVNVTDFTSWGTDMNGGRKLPDGTILQWGRIDISSTSEAIYVLNYPVAFPNAVLRVIPMIENATAITTCDSFAQFVSTTLSTLTLMRQLSGSTNSPSGIGYLAIGR